MSSYDFLAELEPYFLQFDLSDTSSITSQMISVNIAFIVLVAVTITIRLFVRLFMIRGAGIDDALMALAAVFAIVLSALCILGAQYGLGQHIWNIATDPGVFLNKARGFTQALYGAYLAYATAITFTKCSIMASYLRVFRDRVFRWVVYSTGFVVISLWICSVFAIVFQCIPVQAAWDWTVKDAHCIDIVQYFYVSSAVNLVTDLVLLVAPIRNFWKMNMPTVQRVIVCILFGFGGFACVASMLRLAQLHYLHSLDLTYGCISSMNWSVAEVGTAIICGSVPSMRPLARKLLPETFLGLTLVNNTTAPHSQNSTIRKPSGNGGPTMRFGSADTAVEKDSSHAMSNTGTAVEFTLPNETMSHDSVDLEELKNDEFIEVDLETEAQRTPKLPGGVLSPKLRGML